jgi:hypothetical protein
LALRFCSIAIFALASVTDSPAQQLPDYQTEIDKQQLRMDLLDGKQDTLFRFNTSAQTLRGKDIYFKRIDLIQENMKASSISPKHFKAFMEHLTISLQNLNKGNIRFLGYYDQFFSMALELSRNQGSQKDVELLKNHVSTALDCIPFFLNQPYAEEVLQFAATKKPYDVLTKYLDYNREKWFLSILETVAKNDPNAIKQFMGTQHPVNFVLKMSKDPVVVRLYDIYAEYGRSSSGFTNIHLIQNGGISLEESELLSQNPGKWFSKLCELRRSPDIFGSYSVDDELTQFSLKTVRKVNLLHDEKDERIRFASVAKFNSLELYTAMVYSRDEIFTSSFLGMFKRMMQRRTDSSMFVFFQKNGFNRFRTFVQLCAGYNTLQPLLNTMNAPEKDLFLDEIVKDLEKTGGNLAPAVEVADIYGSITDSTLKKAMADKLYRELERCFYAANSYGARLYGMLYKLAGYDPTTITGHSYNFDIPDLTKVEAELLFPDNKNIQQHIFYDDEDGEAAFNSFTGRYRTDKNYKISDAPSYIKIESIVGRKIILYLNKPKNENGLADLQNMFEKQNRYPDIVVHRGHSYHLNTTISVLTNNTKVAVLGSCGGYQNISKVLENATDAQIVSSKQIGTWTVNNELLKDMCEMMRTGNGEINWPILWAKLEPKLKNNDKWKDYIPPNMNLGVKFVKAFQQI